MKHRNQFGDFDLDGQLRKKGWSVGCGYTNAHKKCVFVCPVGHHNLISWVALKLSFSCKSCRDKKVEEKVVKYLTGTEWSLVDVRNGVITIRCKEGHNYVVRQAVEVRKKIGRHPSCSVCEEKLYADNIGSAFDESGWVMLGKYSGYHTPILCECPVGHRQMKAPSGFLSGKGCERCSGLSKKTRQEVEEEFSKFGWKLLGEYINTSTPSECMCPNGHMVKKSLDCLKISRKGCVICSGQIPIHPLVKRKRRNERVKNCREWSPLVLEAGGYRCVICGSTDGVQAHHLNSYHKSVDDRYDLENGVSLCVRHHGGPFNRVIGSFHMVYGCMNNTKEQFEEYKQRYMNGEFDKGEQDERYEK